MRKIIAILLFAATLLCSACDKNETETQEWVVASELGVGRNWATYQVGYIVKRGGSDTWETHLNEIRGFKFEPGYEYRLLVQTDPITNPPIDGSSRRYTLVDVLSRQQKQSLIPESLTPECELIVASRRGLYLGKPCYWVKERSSGITSWAPFTASIEGFDYTPGYEYKLQVSLSANIEDKQYPIKTTFREIISRQEKQSEEIPADTPAQ